MGLRERAFEIACHQADLAYEAINATADEQVGGSEVTVLPVRGLARSLQTLRYDLAYIAEELLIPTANLSEVTVRRNQRTGAGV